MVRVPRREEPSGPAVVDEDLDAEARYRRDLAATRGDYEALMMVVCNAGGDSLDALDLVGFWDSLREDLPCAEHARLTRAWLATCVLRGDSARERLILRRFIARAAKMLGYTRS